MYLMSFVHVNLSPKYFRNSQCISLLSNKQSLCVFFVLFLSMIVFSQEEDPLALGILLPASL